MKEGEKKSKKVKRCVQVGRVGWVVVCCVVVLQLTWGVRAEKGVTTGKMGKRVDV
jgi:hypothetical protein